MKCLDCDEKFRAESSDEMLQKMMPHYMEKHSEMMKNGSEESKKEWFERFALDWDNAEEI